MAKELSEVEKFYIENNRGKTDAEIASAMPGVGAKTVSKYKKSLTTEEPEVNEAEESREERIDRLGKGPKSGDFIARREGVSIMTEHASEVADARAVVEGTPMAEKDFQKNNRDKIHRPQG